MATKITTFRVRSFREELPRGSKGAAANTASTRLKVTGQQYPPNWQSDLLNGS